MTRIKIEADRAEVVAALNEVLTPEELGTIQIVGPDSGNPLDRTPRRAEPLTVTILVFVAGAVLEGVTYDAVKLVALKAFEQLRNRFGDDKVKKDESDQ